MRNKLLVAILFLATTITLHAQVKSPEEFLGYKVGTRYTPHWKIVSYFQYVASAVPSMVKLQQYGETNEGRPLLVAFVSNEQHIQQLESIRLNNLRLANMTKDKMAPVENGAPAIVFRSCYANVIRVGGSAKFKNKRMAEEYSGSAGSLYQS
jgi:hypothetical protein